VSPFEYLLIFAAVVLGLAVTDLAVSLHRLLSAGSRVKWDWLAPLAAAVAFLKIVIQWWIWHAAEGLARGLTFPMFIGVLVSAVLLFLLAAASLPDEIGRNETVDLRAHYAAVSRRYWILFLAHWVLLNAVSAWAQMQVEGARYAPSPLYLLGLLPLSLSVVRARWWHAFCLLGLIVLYLAQFFGQTLA
jgi:hypothetical protein